MAPFRPRQPPMLPMPEAGSGFLEIIKSWQRERERSSVSIFLFLSLHRMSHVDESYPFSLLGNN